MAFVKVWDIKQTKIEEELITALGGNYIVATLLNNRGINTQEKIKNFLNPMDIKISSPDVFVQMDTSIERIQSAIEKKETITVYGDFDADGITSTSILYLTLKHIGATVEYYIPNRATESHGLNTKALINLISKKKSKLIITVDCGITNITEVNLAKSLGTDIIITDHHEAPEDLPNACAIINPKAKNNVVEDIDCLELESLNYLSGAGIAFKLACKLLSVFNKEEFVNEILPLCAIGTIGDVVELIGENRRLVEMGLELIKSGKHKGVQKLLFTSGINDIKKLTSETIAFYIVPRLNAAGRLDSALNALKVLISDDEDELDDLVKLLNDFNSLRQELCEDTFNEAKELYEKDIKSNKKSVILFSENWHIGVIGIVCSKITEEYNKPAFLMTRDPNKPNIIRCSSRSIDGLNIYEILSNHNDIFENFGGHKMAAGFSFDENKISFENFKIRLNRTIEEFSQNINFNQVKIKADMKLDIEDITKENIEAINKLQPFGAGNPSPLFVLEKMNLNNFKMMGQNNNHLKMFLSKNNSRPIECIKWNYPNFNIPVNSTIDILFEPQINVFNGEENIQLLLTDIHSEFLNKPSEVKILDHRNKKDILMQVVDFISSTKKTTGIFLQNANLKKQLANNPLIEEKIFTMQNIPANTEQIMFFDCPTCQNDFYKIIKETDSKIIHLMNFNIKELNTDNFISTLSGMMKYALSNMNGILDIIRAANALNVDSETLEYAIDLFENCKIANLDKLSETEYKIIEITPVELSKIKQDELYIELEEKIKNINSFRNYYLKESINDIKELICN